MSSIEQFCASQWQCFVTLLSSHSARAIISSPRSLPSPLSFIRIMATETCAANICLHPGVRHNTRVLQCYGGCDRCFHWKCIGVNATIVNACKGDSGLFWFCDDCQANSLFILHRKMTRLCDAVQTMRGSLERTEANLESKILACNNMIRNMAKNHILTSANDCTGRCYPHSSELALDLSLNFEDSDKPPDLTAPHNGKRGPPDEPDAVPKRLRNHGHTPTDEPDELADLPTPTYSPIPEQGATSRLSTTAINTNVSSPAPTIPPTNVGSPSSNAAAMHPVAAPHNVSTGKCTHCICPAEAGHDTAPHSARSQPTSAHLPASTASTSASPCVMTQCNQRDVMTSPTACHTSPPPAHFGPSPPIGCVPVTSSRILLTGKRTLNICPAEVGRDSTPFSLNLQLLTDGTEPTATAANATQQRQLSADATATQPTRRLGFTPSSNHLQQQRTHASLVNSTQQIFLPGNTLNGVCLAEANSNAAHFNGYPRLPPANRKPSTAFPTGLLPPTLPVHASVPLAMSTQQHSLSGNARNGVCLAEVNMNAAHFNGPPRSLAANPTTTATFPVGPWMPSTTATLGSRAPSSVAPIQQQLRSTTTLPWIFKAGPSTVTDSQLQPRVQKRRPAKQLIPKSPRVSSATGNNGSSSNRPIVQWTAPLSSEVNATPRFASFPLAAQPSLQFSRRPSTTHTLAPPARFSTLPNQPTIPTQLSQHLNSQPVAARQFYIRPFEPSTTVEQVVSYISSKTGWGSDHFTCQRLASSIRRKNRPLTFVSFRVLVADYPYYVDTITSQSFWPSFVTITPFEDRQHT